MDWESIIKYLLFIVIIILFLQIVYQNVSPKKESFDHKTIQESKDNEIYFPLPKYHKRKVRTQFNDGVIKCDKTCKLRDIDNDTDEYINKNLLNNGGAMCPESKTTGEKINEFHKDFFNFRDKTCNNSSMMYDSVDKVADLYMSGDITTNRNTPNMKIKDLFDYTTQGPNLYTKPCVRVPHFDNINFDGYTFDLGTTTTNMLNTADKWAYKPDYLMNDGKFYGNVRPSI